MSNKIIVNKDIMELCVKNVNKYFLMMKIHSMEEIIMINVKNVKIYSIDILS